MARIVSMNRDELDRRISKAVEAALSKPGHRPPARFRHWRDPVTGQIEMIPVDQRQWGEIGSSPAVVAAIGPLLYDRCMSGGADDGRNFAMIGLARSMQLLAGHASEEDLGQFARDFVTIARGHADGSLLYECSLLLEFRTSDTGWKLAFSAEMTASAVIFSSFDHQTGAPIMNPIVFFIDGDGLGREEAPFSLTLEASRKDHAATQRLLRRIREASRPAPVLSLDDFRTQRAG